MLNTYRNTNNGFDLLVAVAYEMSTQLGDLGTKLSDLVADLNLQPGETIPN